jgi:hypothetical protein
MHLLLVEEQHVELSLNVFDVVDFYDLLDRTKYEHVIATFYESEHLG